MGEPPSSRNVASGAQEGSSGGGFDARLRAVELAVARLEERLDGLTDRLGDKMENVATHGWVYGRLITIAGAASVALGSIGGLIVQLISK